MRGFGFAVLSGLVSGCGPGDSRAPSSVPSSALAPAPAGWTAIPPPAAESEGARCANYARDSWLPSLDAAGRLAAIQRTPEPRHVDTALVPGGRLVSEDRGEFGGQVRWEPTRGVPGKVAEFNLRGFARTSRSLLGLEGLAHLSHDEGQVVRFEQSAEGQWAARPLFALGSAPQAFAVLPGDTLLVVTAKGLSVATERGGARVLHQATQWWLTYPNSVVRSADGTVYVGMRGAVARLTPSRADYREDWLVPASCVSRRLVGEASLGCQCSAGQ